MSVDIRSRISSTYSLACLCEGELFINPLLRPRSGSQAEDEIQIRTELDETLGDKPRSSVWQNIDDAPREKLLAKGAASLSDSELLAIFLRVGYKGKNVRELAEEIIHEKGLNWIMSSTHEDFCSRKGLGSSKYTQLRAALELARRYLEDMLKRESSSMNSSLKMKEYLCHRLGDNPREVLGCLFMDAKMRLIQYKEIFAGTLDATLVSPREIISHALRINAGAIVLAHNHPSGVLSPSEADKKMTQRIKEACALMDIILADHIIVAGSRSFSFCEEGLL